ncbi:hypothetical protein GUITHDRAFT_152734 [Guillardia theta CCMP2712]|uniref:Uncharacterized protein n=1 Tax=Guillardia theta (strain CCMP2712) TaxID=905079 RepID=L1JBK0_GUITC|nr:hypothetical protein GUITHDRAFT_152734 [Guillardia theta CCMP2712]EKX45499.1 hypothetical protein GUITHDRAFT_152734 [Guillardia theta CCMP2712]|eukprot:XP_005832479.1 hypothetical protein GUITHDRAFT_152734 [Guillardia theta CCMP2712]
MLRDQEPAQHKSKRQQGLRAGGQAAGRGEGDLRKQAVALAGRAVSSALSALVDALGAEAGAIAPQVVSVSSAHAANILLGGAEGREVDSSVASQALCKQVATTTHPARVSLDTAEGDAMAVNAQVGSSADAAPVEDEGTVGNSIAAVGKRLDREDGEMAGSTGHLLPADVPHAQT